MARSGITQESVFQVATRQLAAGKEPTIESVRYELGTGSNTTISLYLRAWKTAGGQSQRIASKEHLPVELVNILKGLWEHINNKSEEKIQKSEEEFKQIKVELTEKLKQLQEDDVRLQQQYQEIKQQCDSLVYEKSVLEQLLATARIDMAKLTEKIDALDQRNQEKKNHIEELTRQNKQNQTNLEHYRQSSVEQRQADQQRYEQQQHQLEQIIVKLKVELETVSQENTELQKQNQQIIIDKDNLQQQSEKNIAELGAMTAQFV